MRIIVCSAFKDWKKSARKMISQTNWSFLKKKYLLAVCLLFLVCKWQTYSWYMFAMKLNLIFYENSKFMNTKWWGYLVNFYYFFWNLFFLNFRALMLRSMCPQTTYWVQFTRRRRTWGAANTAPSRLYIYTLLYIVYIVYTIYIYI